KTHVRTAALNRAGLHVAGDAQALGIGAIAHPMQLFDGDVVALTLLHAGVGQVAQGEQNQHHRDPEFQELTGLRRHEGTLLLTLLAAETRVKERGSANADLAAPVRAVRTGTAPRESRCGW